MNRSFSAACAVVLLCATAWGKTDDWNGSQSGLWGDSSNWTKGIPTGSDPVRFNNTATGNTSITLLPSSLTGSLSFVSTGGANPYTFDSAATLNNNTLTVSGGITNSDAGSLTFYNTTTLSGSQSWDNNGGAMAFNGNVNLGSGSSGGTLTVIGAGNVSLNGVVANGGSAAGNLNMAGTGTLTLSSANTYTGTTAINSGTVQTNASGALHSGNALSIAAGGTLNLIGTSQSVGAFTSSGALNLGSSGAFTLLGSASLAGTLSGTGTLTLDAGSTLTLGANFNDSGINIVLNGGTLKLNGTSDTFGSLSITSSSIVDFGATGSSILDVNGVSLAGSATLSVQNWTNLVDYFYSNTTTGTQGTAPESQIVFTGYSGNATRWNGYTDGPDDEHQISPVPEPASYGCVLTALSLIGIVTCRSRKAKQPTAVVQATFGEVETSLGGDSRSCLTSEPRRSTDHALLASQAVQAMGANTSEYEKD